jgi:CDP-6-deoxy-D-xylo-4-hexulose-3-dehydrase
MAQQQQQQTTTKMMKKVWYAPNQFEAYGTAEIAAVQKCLEDGILTSGKYTEMFEQACAALFGKKFGVFVCSGSAAILIGLAMLELPKGSEIVTPACTFATTVSPVEQLGLKPKFVDVELGRYVPSVDAVTAAISPHTRVILLPNLIGSKPDWKNLRQWLIDHQREDIILFEDSADTMTETKESDIAITSFYASHIVTAGGIGGMLMVNKEAHVKRALMYRDWGRIGTNSEDMSERFNYNLDGIPYDFKFLYGVLGYNVKASEMNAAFGLQQMNQLPSCLETRRKNIARYIQNLKLNHLDKYYLAPIDPLEYNWIALPLMVCDRRHELLCYLESNNIQVRVCFSGNITRHPAFRSYLNEKDFPIADRVMKDGFLIGSHQGLSFDQIDHVCNCLLTFARDHFDATLPHHLITAAASSENGF